MAIRLEQVRKFDYVRNVVFPNYSFDSDLEIKVEKWSLRVDSDSRIFNRLESELFVTLNAGQGVLSALDSDSKKLQHLSQRLDSDYRRFQRKRVDYDLKFDSEEHARKATDSDTFIIIKDNDSEIKRMLDSEIHDRKAADSDSFSRIDSDILMEIHDRKAADSDISIIIKDNDSEIRRMLDSDIHDRKAADSDISIIIKDNDSEIKRMLDSEIHDRKAADSDLQTQITDNDSDILMEIHDRKSDDSDIRVVIKDNDSEIKRLLDSEIHNRKASDSDIVAAVNLGLTLERHDRLSGDSDLNTRLTFLENKREDSEQLDYKLDSEEHARKAADSDLVANFNQRLDSDSLAIQTNLTTLENRLDSEYVKNRDWFAYAQQKFDSDETMLGHISTQYVKTVNGISVDINNNVILSIVSVQTGTEDQKRDSLGSIGEGDVWVVSGDSDALNDGRSYIYDSDAASWNRISGFDTAQADARYVNLAGDTMLGAFALAGDPTLPEQAANKHYADAKDSEIKVSLTKEVHDRVGGDSDIVAAVNLGLTLERHDRIAADSDIGVRIKDNDSDILALQGRDSDLSDRISKELHDRQSKDSDLSDRISKELHDRASGDSDLSDRISKELHDRIGGDSDLSDRTSKELHDRAAGDSDLLVRIKDNDSDIAHIFAGIDAGSGFDSDF